MNILPIRNIASAVILLVSALMAGAVETTLVNASFDISREFFEKYNPAFARHWKDQIGESITINQSHGGSSKQARAVIDGLPADVITFNQVTDVDAVAAKGLIAADWRERLPHQSSPFSSTIVFLVRKGNPKQIKDWDDLVKPGISVVAPNPKTSGNGRYGYLSAWAFALKKFNNDEAKARAFVTALFKNVPLFDTGGRGATTTFIQRDIGDVLVSFEAEVTLIAKESGSQKFDVVTPSYSIEAEIPVAVVDKVVNRRGTAKLAKAYLEYLYSDEGQEIAAKNFFRPRAEKLAQKYAGQFGKLELFSVDAVFGSWARAQKTHFAEGGVFDQIQQANR